MAKQTAKSGIMQKLGSRFVNAYNEHKDDEVVYSSFGDLPGGVSGVAKLIECKFDVVKPDEKNPNKEKKNLGQPYFSAQGVVMEPREFVDEKNNVHRVAGKRTSIFQMMCDTTDGQGNKVTVEENTKQVVQHLK